MKRKCVENTYLMVLTILCVIILSFTISIYFLKIIANHYLDKKTINKVIDNININELFKDNGKELEEFTDIKNKFIDAGIPSELIGEFVDTKPIHNLTNDIINNSIDSTLYNKKVKNYNADYIYHYVENNIGDMATELQNKNIPKSELLTEEKQREILDKLDNKMPNIEEKIAAIKNKINDKLEGKLKYIKKSLKVINLFCTAGIDILLIIVFIVFVTGIVVLRKNVIKSLKYIGFSFILSSIILNIIKINIPKIYNKINNTSSLIGNYIKLILDYTSKKIGNEIILSFGIGITLILVDAIIYIIIKIKHKNDKIDQILEKNMKKV